MLHLTLAGLSEDNRRLLLVSDSGEEFTLDIDARLRAALRGEHARLGQLEIHMESTLRPRDIQARIRAGESLESVASAAHTTVDKIQPYADPVLAERAHVAERAQRSSVRRRSGEPGGARTLGDAIAAQLRALNVDPRSVDWDAWRREDGRWTLTAEFATGKRKGTATFAFDAPGNFVLTEDEDARWLVGEVVKDAPAPADELRQARERRRTVPGADELPLGEDAIELVAEEDETTVDLTETAARVRGASPEPAEPVELAPTPEPFAADAEPVAHHDEDAEVAPRAARKRGRASVPSWDEIMFGGGKAE